MFSQALTGIALILLQFVVALPWLIVGARSVLRSQFRADQDRKSGTAPPSEHQSLWAWLQSSAGLTALGILLVGLLLMGLVLGMALNLMSDPEVMRAWGRRYASILQLQLYADLFVLFFGVLTLVWPKGASVALAAFREGYRQPTFWLITLFGLGLMSITPFLPYFTFGEDYVVVQELGYDAVMLCAMLFGVLAAATSISEEIEGRTAITVMSKPISRRQFLLGKFLGITLTCLVLVGSLGWYFQWVLEYKRWFDKMEALTIAPGVTHWIQANFSSQISREFAHGCALWVLQITEVLPGLVKTSVMVMVMVSIAVSLATRLPMVINLVSCLMIYFLSNLMPILVQVTRPGARSQIPGRQLLYFMAQLFDTLLPGLDLLRVNPTLVGVNAVRLQDYVVHVASAAAYGLMYTSLVLLLGLVLFEDRDLA